MFGWTLEFAHLRQRAEAADYTALSVTSFLSFQLLGRGFVIHWLRERRARNHELAGDDLS
jgi:hypothetical protein